MAALRLSIKSTASTVEPRAGSTVTPLPALAALCSRHINPLRERIYMAAPIKVYFLRETLRKYGSKIFRQFEQPDNGCFFAFAVRGEKVASNVNQKIKTTLTRRGGYAIFL